MYNYILFISFCVYYLFIYLFAYFQINDIAQTVFLTR